jgi:glycolate oxidase iron-sulfur subunit
MIAALPGRRKSAWTRVLASMVMPTAVRPPAATQQGADPLVALADRCVQCGLCLPACPTYGRDRLETESPRGRIALARAWALRTIEPTSTGDAHLDHCLGCRSCEAVCPAGVQYGELLAVVRSRQRERRGIAWRQRLIEALAARPPALHGLLAIYRRLYGVLPPAWRRLPRPEAPDKLPESSAGRRADAEARNREHLPAALFIGCVAGPYEAGLRSAVVRLCAGLGVAVVAPASQTCCGSLHAHAGALERRHQFAAINRTAFADVGTVLTLASGCHEAVAQALAGSAETVDAIAFIEARAKHLQWNQCGERVALHLPCTQRNVVKSVPALRRLLARVPGLEVIELDTGYGCCGAAGIQMLTDPARADDYRRPLLAQFEASHASRLLSANIGCRLHFANATGKPVQHPLEFLAGLLKPASDADPFVLESTS